MDSGKYQNLSKPATAQPFLSNNLFYNIFSGHPNYLIQNRYIWVNFQTSRVRFCKLH